MTGTIGYTCPICELESTPRMPKTGDYDEVNCANYGHYRITESGKEEVNRRSGAERREVLEKARAATPIGRIPAIGSSDFL